MINDRMSTMVTSYQNKRLFVQRARLTGMRRACLHVLLWFPIFSHGAAPTGAVSATSIQNFAIGENSRAEVLINAYVGDDPASFTPGPTTVDNIINTAEGGGCAQILINSATAYPCATGSGSAGVGTDAGVATGM